jgi:hypothetical protein
VHIAVCRVLRLRGDLAESIRVGEAAIERLTDDGRDWRASTVMLGSTILAAHIERGDVVYGLVLAEWLIRRANQVGEPKAIMAACWKS